MTNSTATKTRHTPGPWQLDGWGLIYGQPDPDAEEAPFVCDVARDFVGLETDEEWANARLIEAAPEMLDVLRLAARALNTAPRFRVPHLETETRRMDSYDVAALCSGVIRKATGDPA